MTSTQTQFSDELRKEKIQLLNSNPVKFSIVMAVKLMGSMNLKEISQFLGKKDPFVIRFIKGHKIKDHGDAKITKVGLLDDGLIEIDVDKTNAGRGKYYKISALMNELFSRDMSEEFVSYQNNPEITQGWGKEDLDDMRQGFIQNMNRKKGTRHTSDLGNFTINSHTNYEKFIGQKFLQAVDESFRIIKAKEAGKSYEPNYSEIDLFLHSDLNQVQFSIQVANRDQYNRIYTVALEFLQQMTAIAGEIRIENKQALKAGKITQDDLKGQYFYSYSAPLVK